MLNYYGTSSYYLEFLTPFQPNAFLALAVTRTMSDRSVSFDTFTLRLIRRHHPDSKTAEDPRDAQ